MVRKSLVTLLFLLTGVPIAALLGQGAGVTIIINDGRRLDGELLSVREGSIVLSKNEGLDDSDLALRSSAIVVVRNQEILDVIVHGKSNVLNSMGQGILIGGAIGGMIGFASGDDESGFIRFTAGQKALALGVVFAGSGFIIGIISGLVTSTSDSVIEPLPDSDFSTLRHIARYRTGEPEFLKRIE